MAWLWSDCDWDGSKLPHPIPSTYNDLATSLPISQPRADIAIEIDRLTLPGAKADLLQPLVAAQNGEIVLDEDIKMPLPLGNPGNAPAKPRTLRSIRIQVFGRGKS